MLARNHALSVGTAPRALDAAPVTVAPVTAARPSNDDRVVRRDQWIHAALRVVLPWLFVTAALIAHG